MTIRVVLADDHAIVLEGLRALLEAEPDLEVVACCADGAAALRALREHRPDVLVLDLRMPRLDGVEVARQAARDGLETRLILLSGDVAEEDVLEAVRLGVRGVVPKETAFGELARCIRAVHAGEQHLEGGLAARALERLLARKTARRGAAGALSERELELVRLASRGLRNKEIAARLGITEGTVKVHLHRVYDKLGLKGRVELANRALAEGW
jgi:DNA-binding NarL/FixJ family response regulator